MTLRMKAMSHIQEFSDLVLIGEIAMQCAAVEDERCAFKCIILLKADKRRRY
jgi:hypothetical protein